MDSKRRNIWPYGWSHRDTVWSLIWLGTVFVLTVSFTQGDNEAALGYISFASTVVSIILALVAIFYTMVQASDTNQLMTAMKEKLDQVSEQTNRLIELRPVQAARPEEGRQPPGPHIETKAGNTVGPIDLQASTARAEDPRRVVLAIIREAIAATPPGQQTAFSLSSLTKAAFSSASPEQIDQVVRELVEEGILERDQLGWNRPILRVCVNPFDPRLHPDQ